MAKSSRPVRLHPLLDVAVDGAKVEDFGVLPPLLCEAQRAGAPLVDTWVLPAWVFRDALTELPPDHDPASLLRSIHKPVGVERAGRARERLLDLKLPESIRNELADLAEDGQTFLARASATVADPGIALAAGLTLERGGLLSTTLVERAVLDLWSMAVSERALLYLQRRKLRDLAMAVVIQRMPAVTGRGLFVRRHTPALSDSAVLQVALCLGAPVRDGAAARDVLRVGRDGSVLARRIAFKREMLVATNTGLEVVPVSSGRESKSAVSDAALHELTEVARKVERKSCDIEFVIDASDHVRLIGLEDGSGEGRPEGGAPSTIWSRTGLGDLLPGVPTPLSASLVEAFCASSLRKALSVLGGDIARNADLVARVQGRYFLNVSALVGPLGDVPGIIPSTLLEQVRGADPAELSRLLAVGPKKSSIVALSLASGRLLLQERRLDDEVQRFERDADQQRRWLAEMDLAILPDDSLTTTLRETYEFLQTTGRLLLQSSLVAMAAHLALEGALARSQSDAASRRAHTLVAGVSELESVRASTALAHVVELLRADESARDQVLGGARTLDALSAGSGRRAISQWLEGFGDRGIGEVEVAAPRFGEDPSPLFDILRSGLGAPPIDPDRLLSRVRIAADGELAELEASLPRIDQTLVRALLNRARALGRLRERMRVWMARTIAMTRSVALERRSALASARLGARPRGGILLDGPGASQRHETHARGSRRDRAHAPRDLRARLSARRSARNLHWRAATHHSGALGWATSLGGARQLGCGDRTGSRDRRSGPRGRTLRGGRDHRVARAGRWARPAIFLGGGRRE